jgi:N-acetylglucosamine malate deacetylase 1
MMQRFGVVAEVWCGGTLRKYFEKGHKVFIGVVANGNLGTKKYTPEELVKIRMKEQLEAAKTYNAKVLFLGINDYEVVDNVENRKKILGCMRWADPDVIFTHSPIDTTDHGVVGELVKKSMLYLNFEKLELAYPAIKKTPSVFFVDTYAGMDFQPEAYVDISKQYKYKKEAFYCHASQREYSNTGPGWDRCMEIMSTFRGLQYGCEYAEGFIGLKMYGYIPDYSLLPK